VSVASETSNESPTRNPIWGNSAAFTGCIF
jgi:hypothetical protein